MAPVEILAKNFSSRQDLDDHVKNELGDDINANRQAGHTITGTGDELKALSLSTTTRVFGVRVVLSVE